ncbi:hypothetical protein HanRHA438_Chr13g0597921 [Helianthus annuus]|uniref:DUF4283 domain-containing protein n=1 Tax=Helianthus annuus TaxID=4232 RepID=A0A9K3EGX5_HELAN|nr:hypothetical protein HanXRQr2_Chr13g0587311 [Helianthus annuus]KAJ0476825.1 hypothetical protein HanHA300_Chr13g0481611 [Helianthus annuus]KAJ0497649.1 hypothetical protein HanHA89_Chr13g0513641 [Helianthus annuus]KAJ0663654.1 hypothetical protein HanLR1_Chr13g0483521 [Helianthus annuus]KAJ0671152.1 hypothetical protein HanOQP8_Chr13g0482441 [Helianthus annuus]
MGAGADGSKVLILPDRTSAFVEHIGSSVVGRTVDIETLVDFDKLLRIAKIDCSRIQYVGGLSLLISFRDKDSANRFLDSREVWDPWFSKLEVWKGQSLPFERVAWLKIHGIPLHLLETDVLRQVGDLFGKVLHCPGTLDDDSDLSLVRVGVLVGEAQSFRCSVTLQWKDKYFRLWVEEEQEAWVPDCLNGTIGPSFVMDSNSPAMSSPIGRMSEEGGEEVKESGGDTGGEKSPRVEGGCSHANEGSMHEERDFFGGCGAKVVRDLHKEGVGLSFSAPVGGPEEWDKRGGPTVGEPNFNFSMGPGVLPSSKAQRKSKLALRGRKARSCSPIDVSPGSQRPKKRRRPDAIDPPPGFGFIGFTSKSREGVTPESSESGGQAGGLDLNARASSEDSSAGVAIRRWISLFKSVQELESI